MGANVFSVADSGFSLLTHHLDASNSTARLVTRNTADPSDDSVVRLVSDLHLHHRADAQIRRFGAVVAAAHVTTAAAAHQYVWTITPHYYLAL